MNFKSLLIVGLAFLTLYGCSSKTPATTQQIAGLALPQNVVVIQDPSASASLAAVNNAAYNSSGTDYSKRKADMWVDAGSGKSH